MGVRSKQLWEYLTRKGVLDGTDEEIAQAKKDYRKEYKARWKKGRVIKKHELRPEFTGKEYRQLAVKAKELGLTPTAWLRALALAEAYGTTVLPHRERLLKALQLVSLAARGTDARQSINKAEKILEKYIDDF